MSKSAGSDSERPRWRRWALAIAKRVVLYYGLLCIAAGSVYRCVLYPSPRDEREKLPPRGAELVETRTSDGVVVHAVRWRAPGVASTVVVFHGNAQTVGEFVEIGQDLAARGLGTVLVEYRGYGISKDGSPTESGLYADATAVLDLLAQDGTGADRIVLVGISLGTGVAAEMALRGRGRRLVLISPFTSIPRLAAKIAPVLPMSVLVRDRFDTLAKAPSIAVPTLIIHGDRDDVVPYPMGVAVAAAIPGARMVTVAGGRHNDLLFLEWSKIVGALAEEAKR